MIRLQGVRFGFPGRPPLFEGLDLEVADDTVTALLGPSGCGKSTVLRLVAGLLTPASGTIERPRAEPGRADKSLVFQDPRLLPWRTVAGNVELALRAAGVPREEWEGRTGPLLERVGLAHARQLRPASLSGGMAQRAALVRGLALRPRALLLDEPFAAVDPLLREDLQAALQDLLAAADTTTLLVTHDIAEAIVLADRIAVLRANPAGAARIVATIPVPLPRPRDVETRLSPAFLALERQVRAALS